MQTIWLNRLSWRSYTLFCTLISVCLGAAASIVLAALAWFGHVDISLHFGGFYVSSSLLSIVVFFIGPFVGGVIGFGLSLVTYPIFALMLELSASIPLTGRWMDSQQRESVGEKELVRSIRRK